MTAPLFLVPGWSVGPGPLRSTAALLGGEIRNLPGYAESPLLSDFSAAADALAASVPVGSALLGWSLGGTLALSAAARHPDRIGRVITVGSTASFIQRPDWPHAETPESLAAFTAAVLADPAAMLPRFVGNFNRGDRHAKALTRQILDEIGTLAPLETLATGLRWLAEYDIRPLLPKVRCPVLVVLGAHDPLVPPSAAEALVAALPNARLVTLPGCAHAPFLSNPALFSTAVCEFLA